MEIASACCRMGHCCFGVIGVAADGKGGILFPWMNPRATNIAPKRGVVVFYEFKICT